MSSWKMSIAFDTIKLIASEISFLYKYLASSLVRSAGINPLIIRSNVVEAMHGSGYFQTVRSFQLSGNWLNRNLLFSLIQVSKACLVLVRRETSLGLSIEHCQR